MRRLPDPLADVRAFVDGLRDEHGITLRAAEDGQGVAVSSDADKSLSEDIALRIVASKAQILQLLEIESRPAKEATPMLEVLSLAAVHFQPLPLGLPLPTTLRLRVLGVSEFVSFVTHRNACSVKSGFIFDGPEVAAACHAAENDRAFHDDLVTWSEGKRKQPSWRLDVQEAMGPIPHWDAPKQWPLGRMLSHFQAVLIGVGVYEKRLRRFTWMAPPPAQRQLKFSMSDV